MADRSPCLVFGPVDDIGWFRFSSSAAACSIISYLVHSGVFRPKKGRVRERDRETEREFGSGIASNSGITIRSLGPLFPPLRIDVAY